MSGPWRALRHSFRVTTVDDAFAARLDTLFAGLPAADAGDPVVDWHVVYAPDDPDTPDHPWRLTVDGQVRTVAPDADHFATNLLQALNQDAVRSWAGPACHAGCVAREGRAVVLPADPEAGKSTLTCGLVRAGFDYVTDEAVAFTPGTTRITPYPKPIALDPGSWPLFPELAPAGLGPDAEQWQVSPLAIRDSAVSGECDARFLVFPRYVEGAATELVPLPRAEALVELAKNTFEFNQHSVEYLGALEVVVRACTCFRLTVGALADAVACIEELFGDG